MNFTGKELLIFDFDGTLINSIPDLTIAVNEMLSAYDRPPLSVSEVTPFIGNGAKVLVKRALACSFDEEKRVQDVLEEAYKLYIAAYTEVKCKETYLYESVTETLDYLQQQGYKMAICTNKPFHFIEPILDKLAIKKYFSDWVGEDSLKAKKPDALPLLHLVKQAYSEVEKAIMIGDSRNDILAAKNAGMDSIGVSYGYNYHENIRESAPTMVVDSFIELKNLL